MSASTSTRTLLAAMAALTLAAGPAFAQDMERVEIRAGTGNKRSRAVPERLGFTYEGTLRRAQIVDGKWLDSAVYSMLREESGVLFQ